VPISAPWRFGPGCACVFCVGGVRNLSVGVSLVQCCSQTNFYGNRLTFCKITFKEIPKLLQKELNMSYISKLWHSCILVKKKSRKASMIKPLCDVYYCNNPTKTGITSCWFVWDCSVIEFTFFICIYNMLLNLHCILCTALLFFCCSMTVYSVTREWCCCFLSGRWATPSKPSLLQIHPPHLSPAAEQLLAGLQHFLLLCLSVQLKTSQKVARADPACWDRWPHGIIFLKSA